MKKFFNKWSITSWIILIVDLLSSILFEYLFIKINIFPIVYIIMSIILLLAVIITSSLLISKENKNIKKIIGYILSFILVIICLIGSYYLSVTDGFLTKSFQETKFDYYSMNYQVLVEQDSKLNSIEDLKDGKIGYYNLIPNIDNAKKELGKKISFNEIGYDDIIDCFNALNKDKIDAILIEKNLYQSLQEGLDTIKSNQYKVLYNYDILYEQDIEKKDTKGKGFNIYIGGPDFTGTNYDLNMVATINKDTHKVLLTSIPRDYNITIAGKGMKDNLAYAGVWGINTSMATVENLLDVDIHYYVKVNTNSLVGVVDTLGGIQFCSDSSFTTSHALVQGTYDDTKGPKLNVVKGCKNYSGIEILTIARERLALTGGDRKRQENCQQIVLSIAEKMATVGSLVKLNQILDSISKLYTTNVPQELIQDIAKDVLSGNKWKTEQQSVDGTDSKGKVHLGTVDDYIMVPNPQSVDKAILNIRQVMSES